MYEHAKEIGEKHFKASDKTDDNDDSSLADDVSSVDIHHTDAATDNERLP